MFITVHLEIFRPASLNGIFVILCNIYSDLMVDEFSSRNKKSKVASFDIKT